jgi:hypothetical protein
MAPTLGSGTPFTPSPHSTYPEPMSSVQLPPGAEHSYYGGIQTRLPLIYAIWTVVTWLLSPISTLPFVFENAPTTTILLTNGILSAIALGLFVPTIRPSRKGVLNARQCGMYSSWLRVHATVCIIVAVLSTFAYGLSAPFAPIFMALTALGCFLTARHFHRIRRSLEAEQQTGETTSENPSQAS